MSRKLRFLLILCLAATPILGVFNAGAAPIELETFDRTWSRTDLPVSEGLVNHTWMWGPEPFTGAMKEPYAEAPDGERVVQYFDKSRMEDNAYRADPPWDVTNGLLATELMTGRRQLGDDLFEQGEPAEVHVAGDPGDPNAPTYASFGMVMEEDPIPTGWTIIQTIDVNGNIGSDPNLAQYGVSASHFEPETDHNVASVFWDFMNSSRLVYENGDYIQGSMFPNPYYATGYPLTEAYWAFVSVAGTPQWVLTQAFERRVLTYTPGNSEGWKVEAGNVGQHYYQWRNDRVGPAQDGDYGDAPDGEPTGYPTQFSQTGQFPTLYASGGAYTTDLSVATLGPTASAENDANDPSDPDGTPNLVNSDSDNGLVGLGIELTQIPPPAELTVDVRGGTGGDLYLNVLIDLDMDGNWGGTAAGGEPEWVVQNYDVSVGAGETQTVAPPPFAFANGNRVPDGAWMRVALTSEPVMSDDWTGTGTFTAGEIEDHVITFPEQNGKRLPVLVPDCSPSPKYFNGGAPIDFNCDVVNLIPSAGNFTWTMTQLSGGVTVAPVAGGPTPIAAGPGASVQVGQFTATRGLPLPSSWRFRVTAIDPPSVVHPGGVVVGFPDSEIDITFADVGTPLKSASKDTVGPGEWITYTIVLPANPDLESPSEGYIVDPINADFFPGMQDPILGAIECSSGECYYDSGTNDILWQGMMNPGESVKLTYSIQTPEDLLPSEYPDEYVNCANGFDGLAEFFEVCSTVVVED